MEDTLYYDRTTWHELLDRAHRAERDREVLIREALRDHDECHPGSARWCSHRTCQIAEAWARI